MTQVFDASAIVAALLDAGPVGEWCARELVADDVVAPHVLAFEVANIVRRTEGRGAIERSSALAALHDLRLLDVHYVAFAPLTERAWTLRTNLTVYDASYVACAEAVSGRLVTLDRRLARAPGVRCPVVVAAG